MVQSPKWWRKLGAVLAVLVLSMLSFGPTLDGLMCHDEGGASVGSATAHTATVAADHSDVSTSDGALSVCAHGHCHHSTSYIPALATFPSEGRIRPSDSHRLLRERVRISDPKYGLERPPRA